MGSDGLSAVQADGGSTYTAEETIFSGFAGEVRAVRIGPFRAPRFTSGQLCNKWWEILSDNIVAHFTGMDAAYERAHARLDFLNPSPLNPFP